MFPASHTLIAAISALACLASACSAQPASPSETSLDSRIEARIDETLAEGVAGAIVLVEVGGERHVFSRGLANRATGEPMADDDRLRMASVGKLYTAAVIHRLVLDGQVDLDRTAADYVEPARIEGVANANLATIRQLLNHTSGVPDYYDDAWDAQVSTVARNTPDTTLGHIQGRAADFAPGADYAYSNSNYQLLGLVAEAVTGQTLGALMDSIIFTPLHLQATGYNVSGDPHDRIHGYGRGDDANFDTFALQDNNGADGGVLASADDTATFLDAVFASDGALADIGRSMLSDKLDRGDGRYRALGPMYVQHESGLKLVTHSGYIDGYVTTVVRVLAPDITVIVHLNCSEPQLAGTLARDILFMLAAQGG
ncbi:serine hydrolase domain-containing protein [uncultured Maricaulis sp.]|uniref:serine hydrolase domain-containing protein n=1 Tax=uncultured Maricaulis sp. TaxID=174710 RepID=UPI0030DBA339|tara:strand:- start:6530 stop:7639 length:1110 start_codon:yes stop_codon:yes gene_type:complete